MKLVLLVIAAAAAFVPPPQTSNVHRIPRLLDSAGTNNVDEITYLRTRNEQLIAENSKLKAEKEDLKCGLSIVKLRTGWEEFEAEFGSDVHITMYSNETVKKIGWKERNRRKRERKCLLIFEEMKHEERVKRLIEEIEKSDPGPLALKKFAYAISWAFQYLCDSVHVYLEHQVRGAPNLHDLTDDRIAYYALQIFVKYKYVELPSQLQECVSENHTTKAP